ncbi:MAG: hypothetical protein J6C85_08190 [Alphaproteobacteria bacterium]|nr:hypothetical protein [Alphaproteobacteria bacterium]
MAKKYIINQLGRSMIEMLGVLAIVGILSIGAIAGFSKAMAKYKHTRFLATYSMLIQDIMNYQAEWIRTRRAAGYPDNKDASFSLIPYLEQMRLIPTTWQRNGKYIFDDNGGRHYIDVRSNQIMEFQYVFHADESEKPNSTEEALRCVSIINDMLKQFDTLYKISFYKGSTRFGDVIYGKQYCTSDKVCLNNLTYNQIYNQCTACARANSNCGLIINIK